MHRVINCITQQHDWQFLALAAMICGLAVIISLHVHTFASRLRMPARIAWRTAAGASAGFGLWASHLITLLGFEGEVVLIYRLGTPLLTLLGCIVAAILGFLVLGGGRPWHALCAGAVIALGIGNAQIADMHALVDRGAAPAAHAHSRPRPAAPL